MLGSRDGGEEKRILKVVFTVRYFTNVVYFQNVLFAQVFSILQIRLRTEGHLLAGHRKAQGQAASAATSALHRKKQGQTPTADANASKKGRTALPKTRTGEKNDTSDD